LDLDLDSGGEEEKEETKTKEDFQYPITCTELDSCYDIFCDNQFYKVRSYC